MLNDSEVKKLLMRTAAKDQGSADALEKLYKTCAPGLLGVAQRVLGRRELAEEALHDCFTKIWHTAASFDPTGTQPVAWMATIVRNRAIDIKTSHDLSRVDFYHDALDHEPEGALNRLFDWGAGADETEDQRRACLCMRDCLTRLHATERQSLVLAFEHGLSHRDLALHLQKPVGTVKSWVRRGMYKMRHCLACQGIAQ